MRKSIGSENAKQLAETKWWERATNYHTVALIALSIEELTLPFSLLRYAVEQSLRMNVSDEDIYAQTDTLIRDLKRKFKVYLTTDEIVAQVWPILTPRNGKEVGVEIVDNQ